MKRINLCALILLLVASIDADAGVTDGGIVAYRYDSLNAIVIFTDDPNEDPYGIEAPFGAARLLGNTCIAQVTGSADVTGLTCIGNSGDPIASYSCAGIDRPNASSTTWCLFSENPRTGNKAWAVKYVDGLIPTNDGKSIVRCDGTDRFDPRYGCQSEPTEINIKGGYINLDTREGTPPPNTDCAESAHYGRMIVDDLYGNLYICSYTGWRTITTD